MNPDTRSQQSGPALDGVALQELDPFDEPVSNTKQLAEATATEDTTAIVSALRELPFATCASLDDEQTPVRRSSRLQPSVHLRNPDDPYTHRRIPGRGKADNIPRRRTPVPIDIPPHKPQPNQIASTPVTVLPKENDTDPSTNKPTTASSSATAEIDDVFLAGGEGASSSTAAKVPAETASAIERALKALTETSLLVTQQNNVSFLKQIRNSLVEKKTCPEKDRYLIGEKELEWYTPYGPRASRTSPYPP